MEKKNKRKYVRYSSGNDKEFTIFDALLETLIKKEKKESLTFHCLLKQLCSPWNIATLSLIIFGWSTLAWVGQIIWTDLSFYGKDLATTLFASRVGENISLGVDMRVFYYVLLGICLLLSSLTIRFAKRKLHHN